MATTATKKYSELSSAAALDGTEVVAVVQGGSSVRTTTAAVGNAGTALNPLSLGATTPGTGAFTTLASSGLYTPTGGIAPAGGFTVSPRLCHSGGVTITQTTDGNDSTPSTTETYYCEIFVPVNMSITGIALFNGSAVGSDKWVVILWDSNGVALANSALAGTTATGTDAFQKVDLTEPYSALGPATYYVGLQCNGTTARFNTHIAGIFGTGKKTTTTFGTIPNITPPTTFTTALGPIMTLY